MKFMILTNKTNDCFVALDFFGIWIHIWNTGFCPVKKIFSLQMFFYLFFRGGEVGELKIDLSCKSGKVVLCQEYDEYIYIFKLNF